ncbi:retrotransposon gag domain-containing protein, partial [Klebsiella pneumoniae]|nr:retrotransposon gag domain-containing protein [Klebsiella pneumoniae]
KVINCKTSKVVWDKLASLYEGDKKVREAKLQVYRMEFESLKMADDESVIEYLQRVSEAAIKIQAFGEDVLTPMMIKKVLRTLT